MIYIDRYCASIVAVQPQKNKNTYRRPRKIWYNKKNPRSAKKIKTLINYMYESKTQKQRLYFITVTTCQHKSKFSDLECNRRIGLWLKNREDVDYITTVERQRNTEDLHYHIVLRGTKDFRIHQEIRHLAKLYNVEYHPALFEVDRIKGVQKLIGYINKYVTKSNEQYSSLFRCRTWTVSKRFRSDYKKNAYRHVIKISNATKFLTEFPDLEKQHKHDFFTTYKYDIGMWNKAQKYKSAHAGLLKTLDGSVFERNGKIHNVVK